MMHDAVWIELLALATPGPSQAKTSTAQKKSKTAQIDAANADFAQKFKTVLESWRQIYKCLPTATKEDLGTLEPLLKQFGDSYVSCFGNLITPYIHIVVCHTAELIRNHGPLGQYEQQGLENSINIHKSSFFRSSSRGGGSNSTPVTTLMQIMHRFYRLRYFGQEKFPFLFKTSETKSKAKNWQPKPVPATVSLDSLTMEELEEIIKAHEEKEAAFAEQLKNASPSVSEGTIHPSHVHTSRFRIFN
jgi:hypothetical protein